MTQQEKSFWNPVFQTSMGICPCCSPGTRGCISPCRWWSLHHHTDPSSLHFPWSCKYLNRKCLLFTLNMCLFYHVDIGSNPPKLYFSKNQSWWNNKNCQRALCLTTLLTWSLQDKHFLWDEHLKKIVDAEYSLILVFHKWTLWLPY